MIHKIQYVFSLIGVCLFSVTVSAQDLLIGKTTVDITNSGYIHSDDIIGNVYFDAETQTLTLDDATLTNVLIQNNNVKWLNVCLKGENRILNQVGGLFLLKPTRISGEGSLQISCARDYSDIYHEASLLIENCTIDVGCIRGTFKAFLEVRHAAITSQRGIFWHSGVVLKDCEIVKPLGGVYDEAEHAISLRGRIYQSTVIIERMLSSGIAEAEVKEGKTVYYDIHGRQTTQPTQGFYIVRNADGNVEKVVR